MTIPIALLVMLSWLAPQPDMTPAGFKKIDLLVAIENPLDFDGWQVVAATHFGPAHMTVVEPNVPFLFSSKYGTRVYAVPTGATLPEANSFGHTERSEFSEFPATMPPVTAASTASIFSPIDQVLTTLRIVAIGEDGIEFETVGSERFDAEGQNVGWLRLWAMELGLVAFGLVALFLLRRRRFKREAL
ncbi:MAG: hypothetical protein JKY61_06640 [Planctomycetes bacterium]|nr:hypothetical protein [Planctomycetota bacterium]